MECATGTRATRGELDIALSFAKLSLHDADVLIDHILMHTVYIG